jgi:hypothetical protein
MRHRLQPRTLDAWGALAVLVVLSSGLATFAWRHLSNPNIWFDESGQYWLSRGLSHDSPLDAPGQWLGVGVLNGMTGFNLDPPGFTVGLGLTIQALGSSPAALRVLPFAAFVATIAVAYLIGRRVLHLPRTVSLGVPPLALTTALPLYYATEIRAYSAELLAVAGMLLVTALLVRSGTVRGAIPFALVLIAGMLATRYYFIVAAASAALVYAVALVIDRGRRSRLRQVAFVASAYVVAGIGTAWSIGFIGPGRQYGYGEGYAHASVSLRDASDVVGILRGNLANGEQWATGIFICLGAILLIVRGIRFATTRRSTPRPVWILLWSLVVSYEGVAATLSYVNDIQWDAGGRWSIGLWAMAAASLLGLFSIAKTTLFPNDDQSASAAAGRRNAMRRLAVVVTAIIVAVTTTVSTVRLVQYDRPQFRFAGSKLVFALAGKFDPSTEIQWAVDYWSWPTFRWLVRESGLWPDDIPVTSAIPVGDGVNTNVLWQDAIPNLALCPPGRTTIVLHEAWSGDYLKRTTEITNWGQQQRCRVTQVPISDGEIAIILSPIG